MGWSITSPSSISLILLKMTRSRTSLHKSQGGSPESEGDSSDSNKSPKDQTPLRGRYAERYGEDTDATTSK